MFCIAAVNALRRAAAAASELALCRSSASLCLSLLSAAACSMSVFGPTRPWVRASNSSAITTEADTLSDPGGLARVFKCELWHVVYWLNRRPAQFQGQHLRL